MNQPITIHLIARERRGSARRTCAERLGAHGPRAHADFLNRTSGHLPRSRSGHRIRIAIGIAAGVAAASDARYRRLPHDIRARPRNDGGRDAGQLSDHNGGSSRSTHRRRASYPWLASSTSGTLVPPLQCGTPRTDIGPPTSRSHPAATHMISQSMATDSSPIPVRPLPRKGCLACATRSFRGDGRRALMKRVLCGTMLMILATSPAHAAEVPAIR